MWSSIGIGRKLPILLSIKSNIVESHNIDVNHKFKVLRFLWPLFKDSYIGFTFKD